MEIINEIKQEILQNIKLGHEGIIPLKGVSMEPTMHDGALLYVQSCSDYSVGDIVVFCYQGEGYLVHRIIEINKGAVLCKGDNSKRIEVILKRQIVGKVVRFVNGECVYEI